MMEGVSASLLCSLCDSVCKRGTRMKCCGTRACRACAVLKINKTKKCWNQDCAKENVIADNDLENDHMLRKAVEHFHKNGKMEPVHEEILQRCNDVSGEKKLKVDEEEKDPMAMEMKSEKKSVTDEEENPPMNTNTQEKKLGKYEEKKGSLTVKSDIKLVNIAAKKSPTEPKSEKKLGKDEAMEKAPMTAKIEKKLGKDEGKKTPMIMSEKFNQPCRFAEKCKRKTCLFVHDKPIYKSNGKPCKFGTLCFRKDSCLFEHPKVNKPCKFGAGCTNKSCSFDHCPSSKARAMLALKRGMVPTGGDLRTVISHRKGMRGAMDRGGVMGDKMASFQMGMNPNLEQMLNMKVELDSMIGNVISSRRASSSGMASSGVGYGKGAYHGGGYGKEVYDRGQYGGGAGGYGEEVYDRGQYGKEVYGGGAGGYGKEVFDGGQYGKKVYDGGQYGKEVYDSGEFIKEEYGGGRYANGGYDGGGYGNGAGGYGKEVFGGGDYGKRDHGGGGYGNEAYGKGQYGGGYGKRAYEEGYGGGGYGQKVYCGERRYEGDGYSGGYGEEEYRGRDYGKRGHGGGGYSQEDYG